MNKILLFAITLLLPIGLNAQTNYLQEKVAEYYTGSIEQKIKMDSIYQEGMHLSLALSMG